MIGVERNNLLHNLFERIFFQQSQASQLLLIDFLNAVLSQSLQSEVQTIRRQSQPNYYLNSQQLSWDVKVETKERSDLNIRIQVHQSDYFQKQTQHFMVNFNQNETRVGHEIKQFIIHILNFNLLQEEQSYHNCYYTPQLQNSNYQEAQEIHYLELPKFTSTIPTNLLEKWLYFMIYVSQEKTSHYYHQLVEQDPSFKLAEHLYTRATTSRNEAFVVKEQQLDLTEWKHLGQKIEKEQIALKMIKSGLPYQQIMMLTDLSLAELDTIALTVPLIES